MTQEQFGAIAGAKPMNAYPVTWLMQVVIGQMDESELAGYAEKAIAAHRATMARIEAEHGVTLGADGKRIGDAGAEVSDQLYGAAGEIAFLERVLGRIRSGAYRAGADGLTPGQRLRTIRQARQMTVAKLSKLSSVSHYRISVMEDGGSPIGPGAAQLMAKHLDVSPEAILEGGREFEIAAGRIPATGKEGY